MASSLANGTGRSESATFDYVSSGLRECDDGIAQRESFEAQFDNEWESVRAWSAKTGWERTSVPDLQVIISKKYKISKALVHIWDGHPGRMEFPDSRVMAGKAAITHELVHVFFPNANRFLAEGLAVHLQSAIGSNPAFPNFGRPLHALARDILQEIVCELRGDNFKRLQQVSLSPLDEIATPSPLVLKVGEEFYGEDARGQMRIYSLTGSFAQFLIEMRGNERFHALYLQTPLVPFVQYAGGSDRWRHVYGLSLAELEHEWKAMLTSGDSAF
jgi:hypothetical protein